MDYCCDALTINKSNFNRQIRLLLITRMYECGEFYFDLGFCTRFYCSNVQRSSTLMLIYEY